MTARRDTRRDNRREARARIHDLARRALSPEQLAVELIASLQLAVPGDGYRLFGVDPATRLFTRLLAASADDGWARLEWLREVYLRTPARYYIEHEELLRLGLPAVAIQARQDTCWGYPPDLLRRLSAREHEHFFHELRSPVGGTLLAHFAAAGRWVAALQLYRRDDNRPFQPDDVEFVRRMGPLIGVAIDAAIRREQATMAPGNAPDTAGVILLSGDRRPTVSTPAGEYWLRRLRDADRDGHAPLPIAVWAAVAGLRSGGTSARSLTVATPDGDVRIEASLAEADGAVAIVVVPVRPPNPPTIPDSWGLTSRERAVVQLVLRGLGNREIAEGLFISENTVEFHLRHIYEKLAIRGRSQLLARFFRETFWPHLAAPVDGGRRLDTGDR